METDQLSFFIYHNLPPTTTAGGVPARAHGPCGVVRGARPAGVLNEMDGFLVSVFAYAGEVGDTGIRVIMGGIHKKIIDP